MAGTIIADKIQTENSFLTLNVGQTQIATMNASGVFSNTGIKMIGTDGTVTAILSSPTISGNLNLDSTGTTGVRVPSANTLVFYEGGVEAMRIDSSGNVGIGTTPSSWDAKLAVFNGNIALTTTTNKLYLYNTSATNFAHISTASDGSITFTNGTSSPTERMRISSTGELGLGANGYSSTNRLALAYDGGSGVAIVGPNSTGGSTILTFGTSNAGTYGERMRITADGELLVGKTSPTPATVGCELRGNGVLAATRSAGPPGSFNRTTDDGDIISLQQAGTQEGSISVSGTTVSYNGGHLSRYAQIANGNTNIILKGTVLSNLDEMNVYIDADGNPVTNEQLNKVKISNIEADANVAGVFVNWAYDEQHDIEEINMAMTGDMIIRIAEGVTVARGDLLMSAGDGTAKPQSDDIVRSKTIAKVTSTHVTCTYEDGSYCVPCVLMAC